MFRTGGVRRMGAALFALRQLAVGGMGCHQIGVPVRVGRIQGRKE